MSLILYELGGLDDCRYSQFSWRARLALAHKGLEAEIKPVRISDKASLAFSHQNKVPVLVDGDKIIPDSWAIAEYLEQRAPAAPSLFGGDIGRGTTLFINHYVDRTIVPRLAPLLMVDVVACVDADDSKYLRSQMEGVFRSSLEELAANRDKDIAAFRKLLDPARAALRKQPFLCGQSAAYADYILFSVFQWARIVSKFDVLETGDAVSAWRDRMLSLHGGSAEREPSRTTRSQRG